VLNGRIGINSNKMNTIAVPELLNLSMGTWIFSLTLASVVYFTMSNIRRARSATYPYPPGPPREPLIGSMRSFPKDHFFERFDEWATTYGTI
jgi:hypothetical protein